MCSGDTCQLQGWDLQPPLGAPGPQGRWLSVSPWVTGSPGAQSQPSTEHLFPAGFPQHTVWDVCARFAGNSPHGCIYKIRISNCLYLFLQQKKCGSLGKISKICALLLSPSPLWTLRREIQSLSQRRETTFPSTHSVL